MNTHRLNQEAPFDDTFDYRATWASYAARVATLAVLAVGMNVTENATANPDPMAGELEIEITQERLSDGIHISHLYFTSHRIDDEPVRIFGIYARPAEAEGLLPGILFIHGGGQNADEPEVIGWARRGYAAFSHDWYPNEEVGQANRPNRWPFHEDGRRKQAEPAALDKPLWINRRALTLLARQPETDPDRLGVCGFSWGGYHTWEVTAADARVKAAVPSCGYAPRGVLDKLRAPVLFSNASEDFFARMDQLQESLKAVQVEFRLLVSPNENHNLAGTGWETTHRRWFDHWLKGGPPMPAAPQLAVDEQGGDAAVRVRAPGAVSMELLYSYGTNASGGRCWFGRTLRQTGNGEFSGPLPPRPGVALWIFANAGYPDGMTLSTWYTELPAPDEPPPVPSQALYDPAVDGRHPWYFTWRGPVADHPWRSWGGTDLAVTDIEGRPALYVKWGTVSRPDSGLFRAFFRGPACPLRKSAGNDRLLVDVHGPRPLRVTVEARRHGIFSSDPNPFRTEVTVAFGEGWITVELPAEQFQRAQSEAEPGAPLATFDDVQQFHVTLETPESSGPGPAIGGLRWSTGDPQ